MPGGEKRNTDIKRDINAHKISQLERNIAEVMPDFVEGLSHQITGELKKAKSIEDLEVSLDLTDLEEHFIISALTGYMDKLDIKKQTLEFEEELNPFSLKYEDAIKYLTSREPKLWEDIEPITEEIRANFKWIKKSTDLEVTKRMMQRLEKAVEDGATFEEWKETILEDAIKEGFGEQGYYLENIFRTNVMSGYNVGAYREQMSSKDQFPYLMYDAVGDENTTEICRGLDGKIYLATDPIWNDIYPPNHYQCRSGVISMTEEEFIEDGLKLSSGEYKIGDLGTFKGNPEVLWKSIEKSVKLKEKVTVELKKKLKLGFEGIKDQKLQLTFKKAFENSPEEIKNIVENNIKDFKAIIGNGDFYTFGTNTVTMGSYNEITAMHEFGHYIDNMEYYKKYKKRSQSLSHTYKEEYETKLQVSMRKIIEGYKGKKGTGKVKVITEKIKMTFPREEMQKKENGAIQDMVEGLTKGRTSFSYGHGKSYWKNEAYIHYECFAQMFSLYIRKDSGTVKKQIEILEEFYPEMWNEFKNLILELGGK